MFNASEYNFLVVYSKHYFASDSFFIITLWKLDIASSSPPTLILQSMVYTLEGGGKGGAWESVPSQGEGLWR